MPTTPMLHVTYVSKFPPIRHGVSTYADAFAQVLRPLGHVTRVSLADDSGSTQSFRSAIQGIAKGVRQAATFDIVVVELSGRALAELFFLVGVILRRRRGFTAVTCHDPPSIVGESLLFSCFDRRGLRRVGTTLSRFLGTRLERWVLARCDVVCALTEAGAESLSSRLGRPVESLGHVLRPSTRAGRKEQIVFLPGWVSPKTRIADLASTVSDAGDGWRLIVGAANADHVASELSALSKPARSVVIIEGEVDHDVLMATYARARVVVRMTGGEAGANSLAASGPLAWAVANGCHVVTDDSRAVVDELAALGLMSRSADVVGDLRTLLIAMPPDDPYATAQAELAEVLFGVDQTAARFRIILEAAGLKTLKRGITS